MSGRKKQPAPAQQSEEDREEALRKAAEAERKAALTGEKPAKAVDDEGDLWDDVPV
ncbi:hypothetical protein [Frigidibacter sp. ROC022]|uniref:hypothetical protein n=1 Tax=Frigidibacter sp. ROC022 TaxID=2971796 RepID=UPI00215ADF27|nr:hypothetical protein [Frigidibacter sp. ROC022]MCR8723240.1 hypothetical protein [Frigidibacter sp. ROC022]